MKRIVLNLLSLCFALLFSATAFSQHQPAEVLQVPKADLKFWNQQSNVYRNNCYNYSTNRRTNSFAQPGEASDKKYREITCDSVAEAAAEDIGLYPVEFFEFAEKQDLTLIALVVASQMDYHWYRRDANNMWTHKPGGTPATLLDNSGYLIRDPEKADRGRYDEFCGYFAIENYPTTEDEQNAGYVRIGNMTDLPDIENDRTTKTAKVESYVEFLVFSGRPNPTLPLKDFLKDGQLEKELLSLDHQASFKKQKRASTLGYNGILIHDTEQLVLSTKSAYVYRPQSKIIPGIASSPESESNGTEKDRSYNIENDILEKAANLGLKDILAQSGAFD